MTLVEKTQMVLDEMGILLKKKPISATTKRASLLKQRLKNYEPDDLILFVKWQWKQWNNWELREEYFRPETLFQKNRVLENMDKVVMGEAPLNPEPKEDVDKHQCSLNDYRSYVLRGGRYYGYHYRRMNDLKKKKIDDLILQDYQSGIPAYHCLNLKTFESIRKESHERP